MANQINVTSGTGNIQVTTSRSVISVTTVANANVANTANYAGNVTVNAQPNITSLGTLTGLTSTGNITAPYFIGNVVGNISGNIVVPGTNTSVLFNQVGSAGASDALQFDYSANVLKVTGNANVTGKLTLGGNIEGNLLPQANGTQDIGSNTQRWNDLYLNGNTIYLGSQTLESNATHTIISGVITGNGAGLTNVDAVNANTANVANVANTANSVAVANVSGIGSIATVNLDGNVSNVLRGDGTFAPEASNLNANYANFAGTAFSVSGSNVSGAVANATYADSANTANSATVAASANSVAGANVSGTVANAAYADNAGNANTANSATVAASANSVAVANVSGIGNIATINLDGNLSNILYGNGVFAAVPNVNNVANANYANFAGTAFSVSGSNVSGAVANATYADNAGNANTANSATVANSANSVAGANVTGTVANATFATSAGTANSATVAASANSVAGANVSGTVANATYAVSAGSANTANTVTDNAQPNITSVGTLTNLAVTGNITANTVTANYLVGNVSLTNIDSLYFDTAAGVTLANVGQVAWDDGDGTLQLLMKGGNVVQQIGTQEYARVYNAEATTLNKGEVVYVFGAQGNRLSVKRAQANTEATSFGTVGFVAETIASGQEGFIITSGALYKLNTLGLTAGNAVYLSPSVAGGYTTTKPVAPNQLVVLGWIERVSATVGSIYVKVDNGYEIDELHDVLITSPTAGQALVYNASNLWVNGNPNVANSALSVAGANVVGEVANANFASFSNVANSANAVAGANVSGEVANANFASYANIANSANSVSVANVSGIGNIATVNLDGNASNILYGNGAFAAVPNVNNVANANYANFAGTAYSVAGANVSGEVAFANMANYAGNITVSSQPNITSVGNLTSLTVVGAIDAQANVNVDGTIVLANTVQIDSPGYYLPYGFSFNGGMPNSNVVFTFTVAGDVTSGSNVISNVALSDAFTGSPLNLSTYAPLLANLSLIPQSVQGVGSYNAALPVLGTISNVDTSNSTITYSNNFNATTSLNVNTGVIAYNTPTDTYFGINRTVFATATATDSTTNEITLDTVDPIDFGLGVGGEIVFVGTSFGNIAANTVYYVDSVVSGNTAITISETSGGPVHTLTTATGSMTVTQSGGVADTIIPNTTGFYAGPWDTVPTYGNLTLLTNPNFATTPTITVGSLKPVNYNDNPPNDIPAGFIANIQYNQLVGPTVVGTKGAPTLTGRIFDGFGVNGITAVNDGTDANLTGLRTTFATIAYTDGGSDSASITNPGNPTGVQFTTYTGNSTNDPNDYYLRSGRSLGRIAWYASQQVGGQYYANPGTSPYAGIYAQALGDWNDAVNTNLPMVFAFQYTPLNAATGGGTNYQRINRTFLQAANNTTSIGGATNIEFKPLARSSNGTNNRSPSALGNVSINPQKFVDISGYTQGNAVSNGAGAVLNVTTTASTWDGNVALRLSRTVGNTANMEFRLNQSQANTMVLVDNASGNTLATFTDGNSNFSGALNTTGAINVNSGNVQLFSNGAISATTFSGTTANITGTTTTKLVEQNLGTSNLTPGGTLNLASDVEQYVKITLTTGGANTSTINCANLDTAGVGKTYKFLVYNNSGASQNVQSSGLAQVNPTTSIGNGNYGLLQVDTFGTDGSGVWIWSNLA